MIKYSIVFDTNSTRNGISANFEPTFLEFAKGIPSEYWADKCYILDKDTIAEATKITLLPQDGIGVFFSSQKLSLLSSEFQDDPTTRNPYSIAKEPAVKSVTVALLEISDQKNKQFKKKYKYVGTHA